MLSWIEHEKGFKTFAARTKWTNVASVKGTGYTWLISHSMFVLREKKQKQVACYHNSLPWVKLPYLRL